MKIEKKEGNENEKNENEIDVEKNAMSDDDDKTIKDDHYFESPYQN